MAEDEDGVSNKNSPQNTNNGGPSQENEQNAAKPDLGIEEAKYNSNENGDASLTEAKSSSSSEFTKLFFVLNIKAFLVDCSFFLQSLRGRRGRMRIRFRFGIF